MTAVPMGVDAALFDRAAVDPVDDPRLDSRRVVLYLGRIAQSRRSDFLLDVADRLRENNPEVLLVIAGDAPSDDEMAWMRREIVRRGLDDHVLLTGWLPQRTALGYAVRAEVGPVADPARHAVRRVVADQAGRIPGARHPQRRQRYSRPETGHRQSGAGLCVPMEATAFADAVQQLLNDGARGRVRVTWATVRNKPSDL
jgi:hypothetical protein